MEVAGQLKGTALVQPENARVLDELVFKSFEQRKRTFSNNSATSWIRVGGLADNDPARGIKGGRLKIPGYVSS